MTENGVTYYKLVSQYEGDETKNCGLSSTEMDLNFNFLRGNDIDYVAVVDDGCSMEIAKLNGEKISVPVIHATNEPFEGATLKYKDGKVIWA